MKYNYSNLDEKSYHIGIAGCYCEMVAAGIKKLGFSAAIRKEDISIVTRAVREIAQHYDINYYVENNLIKNNIAPESYVDNKYVILIYKDYSVIKEYLELKRKQDEHIRNNTYDDAVRRDITVQLCRLLSYTEKEIEEKYMSV